MTSQARIRSVPGGSTFRVDEAAGIQPSFACGGGAKSGRKALSAGSIALAGTLLTAGLVHLALVPEHLTESVALGFGFLGSGLAQVGLAAILIRSHSIRPLHLALWISVLSLGALALAVTVGLPVLAHGDTMGVLGPVEELDDLAALTGFIEFVSIVLAIRLLRRDGDGFGRSSLPRNVSG